MNFNHKGLGFHPGPVDDRDRPLGAAIDRLGAPKTTGARFWYNGLVLDQGKEGACVGFGWTQSVNAAPITHKFGDAVGHSVYRQARRDFDEWPGEDYEGTSVRAGAKASVARGWIRSYAFAESLEEVALWVLNRRPVVIGIDWRESDYAPTRQNNYFLTGEGEVVGGHCLIIDGVSWGVGNDYFRVLNSWGRSWGYNGRAKVRPALMEQLLFAEPYAVACTAVEVGMAA